MKTITIATVNESNNIIFNNFSVNAVLKILKNYQFNIEQLENLILKFCDRPHADKQNLYTIKNSLIKSLENNAIEFPDDYKQLLLLKDIISEYRD